MNEGTDCWDGGLKICIGPGSDVESGQRKREGRKWRLPAQQPLVLKSASSFSSAWVHADTSERGSSTKAGRQFADNGVMDEERRTESRMLCADMVDVGWADPAGRTRHSTALLEDISLRGACLQLEFDLPLGTEVAIDHAKIHIRGTVRYCAYREIGYFLGIEFQAGSEWSRSEFTPDHMLDLEELIARRANRAPKRTN